MANRLADEPSPYLRQHRDNPVDWFPWGDDAFARAEQEDKPVLLSVGYSACHWCHVMAHESFEDQDTAALMNDLFVNVKVDREERPDVDAVYMDAVQAMTGHGGWPMTVFLTPTGEPFYGGTYFPRVAQGGMPSFTDLCRAIHETWEERRDDVTDQAGRLTEALTRSSRLTPGSDHPGTAVVDAAVDDLIGHHDSEYGGFGTAPKFPQAMALDLLMRVGRRNPRPDAQAVVTRSLDAMAAGGIYDHLGGGFARYSVDQEWLVPHFEKMLYDQALLTRAYLHAWQLTGRADYRQVLDETVTYVLRDLRHDSGGLFSAEDADSEGVEGKFSVWTPAQIEAVLGTTRAQEAIEWYGVTSDGNFEGANILHRPLGAELIRPDEIESARRDLLEARDGRARPGLDDKVLTEWNALMLSSLAEAAAATGNADWLAAAEAVGDFLCTSLRRPDGRWMRSWQGGGDGREPGARHLAYAADHAALVDGFTALAEATVRSRWIHEAEAAAAALIELFWDDEAGGVFTTGADADALVARQKDFMDNATPSANSTAALALLRLGALTGATEHRELAEQILVLFGPMVSGAPSAFSHLLAAVELADGGMREVAVVGDRPDLVAAVTSGYRPDTVLAWGERYESPIWADRTDGHAYVCRDYACLSPTDDVAALRRQLED